MGFNNPIIGGGGALVYPSIHSPDYVPNVSGWAINKDGSAEFNDVIILGGGIQVEDGSGNTLAIIDSNGNITGQTISANTDFILPDGNSLYDLVLGMDNPDPWHNMTLINGNAAGSSGNAFPAYRQSNTENITYISGVVRLLATRSSNIFATLPSGYYNPNTQIQASVGQSGGAASIAPFVQCDTSGNLTIVNAPALTVQTDFVINATLMQDIPNNPTSGGGTGNKTKRTTTYVPTIWSYYGNDATGSPNGLRSTANIYQGGETASGGTFNGTGYGYADFSATSIQSDLTGATIDSCYVTVKCLHSWYDSGATVYMAQNAAGHKSGSSGAFSGNNWSIGEGQVKSFNPGNAYAANFQSGAADGLEFGPGPAYNLQNYAELNSVRFTVTYTK
jgi:hypothetical protein